MKTKQHTSLILRHGAPEDGRKADRWLQLLIRLILLWSVAGGMGSFAGLWKLISPAVLLVSGSAVCVGAALLRDWKYGQWLLPGVLAMAAAAAVVFGRWVAEGACLAWNQGSAVWTAATGVLLPELELQGTPQLLSLTVFCVVLGLLLGVGCCLCGRKTGAALAVLLPMLLFVAEWRLGGAVSPVWVGLLLTVSILLLLQGGWSRSQGEKPAVLGFLTFLPAAAVLLAVLQLPALRQWTQQMEQQTASAVHAWRYETDHTGLPEGNFSADWKDETGYTALLVTMEQPERLFLRGFAGDTFTDDQWKPIENTELEAEKELLYWLKRDSFAPQGQLTAAAEAAGLAMERQQIGVQNLNGCSEMVYVPHTLAAQSLPGLTPERLEPSVIRSVGLQGQRSYGYASMVGLQTQLPQLLQLLQTEENEKIQNYRQAESSYRQFVRRHDLQVPETFTAQLGQLLDACCEVHGSHTELTTAQAQASALDFLSLCFGDSGMDIPLPLAQISQGQYQYVTVAVLALRYYGIPARYAEGYEITADMAAQAAPGEAIEVDGSCGRAWVEVYQEGVGWMPMELTPGYEALIGKESANGMTPVGVDGVDPHAQIGTVSGDGTGMTVTEGMEHLDLEAEQTEEEDQLSDGGTMARIQDLLRWSGWLLLAAVLLAVVLVVLRRQWKLRRKRQLFALENRSEAIGWIYADAAQLLSRMGLDRNGGSMERVCAMAAEQDAAYGELCRRMTRLNGEALFSSHELSEQQRQEMLSFHGQTLSRMKQQVKWHKKLWLCWALCLY